MLVMLAVVVVCLGYWWYTLVFTAQSAMGAGARVHFLNVGQGDAVLIETENGRRVLVDAGREHGCSPRSMKLYRRMKKSWTWWS